MAEGWDVNEFLAVLPLPVILLDREGRVLYVNPAAGKLAGCDPGELVGRAATELFPDLALPHGPSGEEFPRTGSPKATVFRSPEGGEIPVEIESYRPKGAIVLLVHERDTGVSGSGHKGDPAFTERLRKLHEATLELLVADGVKEVARRSARLCVEKFGADLAWVGFSEPDGRVLLVTRWPETHPFPEGVEVRWDETPAGQGPTGKAIRSGVSQVVEEIPIDSPCAPLREAAAVHGFRTGAAFPLSAHGRVLGTMNLYSRRPGFFSPERQWALQALADHTAALLERARHREEAERRLARLQSLREIDLAITSSMDIKVIINVLLGELISRLGVDAAAALLIEPDGLTMRLVGAQGFAEPLEEGLTLDIGRSLVREVLREGRTLYFEADKVPEWVNPLFVRMLDSEGFVAFHIAPMISRGSVLGVIGAFHRLRPTLGKEWRDFLDSLASQAAIAVENAELLERLRRSNLELRLAYEAMLESWGKVLELRDRETQGHTERVTALTLKLARELGVEEGELTHIRWGALLHDVGKLRIPDSILSKPGRLTEEEWGEMRKHPVYAYELLSQIDFLKPALDIPYCHHERWDGKGYPRGLRGEEIPLSARIFAVVDAWDAMTHDRPYRKALPREEAIEELKRGAGTQFDPAVVTAFLRLLRRGEV